jgi:hypothetical protein
VAKNPEFYVDFTFESNISEKAHLKKVRHKKLHFVGT